MSSKPPGIMERNPLSHQNNQARIPHEYDNNDYSNSHQGGFKQDNFAFIGEVDTTYN